MCLEVESGAFMDVLLPLYVLLFCPVHLGPVVIHDQPVVVSSFNKTCDRTKLLQHVFRGATEGSGSNQERVERWTTYLQNLFQKGKITPLDEQGQAVYDPLWLLQNRTGQCGQVNRILVDGLLVAGIKARLIQLNGHVAAEAFYEGAWHYVDAFLLRDGAFVQIDGEIPSIREIIANPDLLKGIPQYQEWWRDVFRKVRDYSTLTTPYVIEKTATDAQLANRYYGWNYYRLCSFDGQCVR